jgi:hypothetical protein
MECSNNFFSGKSPINRFTDGFGFAGGSQHFSKRLELFTFDHEVFSHCFESIHLSSLTQGATFFKLLHTE